MRLWRGHHSSDRCAHAELSAQLSASSLVRPPLLIHAKHCKGQPYSNRAEPPWQRAQLYCGALRFNSPACARQRATAHACHVVSSNDSHTWHCCRRWSLRKWKCKRSFSLLRGRMHLWRLARPLQPGPYHAQQRAYRQQSSCCRVDWMFSRCAHTVADTERLQ